MTVQSFLKEFWQFGWKNALSCLFPAYIFGMLGLSHLQHYMPRYDFMLLAALLMQALMYFGKLETRDELLVICLFHLLGVSMEFFKVHIGSWSYPEFAYSKIAGVPLYSGFMYASVASFMCQAWRRFDLQMQQWPDNRIALLLAALIYLNFYSNHFIPDMRYVLGCAVIIVFRNASVCYTPGSIQRSMPVLLSFMLIGFFIWLAENIATLLGAWKYTYQHSGWAMVKFQKISSWIFLVMVSYIIVAGLQRIKKQSFSTNSTATVQ